MIHNQKRPVSLLVYNIDRDAVRETSVIPDFEWGGPGCLGCDVASGALHRIPKPDASAAPGVSVPIPQKHTEDQDYYQETALNAAFPTTASEPVLKSLPKNMDPIPAFASAPETSLFQ